MKTTHSVSLLFLYFCVAVGEWSFERDETPVYTYLDNSDFETIHPNTYIVPFTISASGNVADIYMEFYITTSWAEDVDIVLTSITLGKHVDIFTDVGGSSNNLGASAADPMKISEDFVLTVADFLPGTGQELQPSMSFSSVFDGDPIAGDWELSILDDVTCCDDGLIQYVYFEIYSCPVAVEVQEECKDGYYKRNGECEECYSLCETCGDG